MDPDSKDPPKQTIVDALDVLDRQRHRCGCGALLTWGTTYFLYGRGHARCEPCALDDARAFYDRLGAA